MQYHSNYSKPGSFITPATYCSKTADREADKSSVPCVFGCVHPSQDSSASNQQHRHYRRPLFFAPTRRWLHGRCLRYQRTQKFFLEPVASFSRIFLELQSTTLWALCRVLIDRKIMCQSQHDWLKVSVIMSEHLRNPNNYIPIEQPTFQSATAHRPISWAGPDWGLQLLE